MSEPLRSAAPPRLLPLGPVYAAFLLLVLTGVGLAISEEPEIIHWFLVPLLACAALTGLDAVRWFTGRMDTFSPAGIIGILGVHLFFIAPLLVVLWDMSFDVAASPPDWRPWLGWIATLSFVGLVVARNLTRIVGMLPVRRPRAWVIRRHRVLPIMIPALLISGAAQVYLWVRLGGISGVASAFSETPAETSGLYRFQLLASSFPVLILMAITTLRGDPNAGGRPRRQSLGLVALIVVFVLYFIVDGLRGSRSAIVWTMFWAAGVVHYFWRPLKARTLILALLPALTFMYLYGFYKAYGDQVLERYEASTGISEMSEHTGRTFRRLVISDLSRADIQAYLVYQLDRRDNEYELAGGWTYLEAFERVIPPALLPGRAVVPRKALAGAALIYGPRAASQGVYASKVYGLSGEAILNFGIWGVIPAFAVFGVLMGLAQRAIRSWPPGDPRFLIAPLIANLFVALLVGDLDNAITFSINKGVIPLLLLLILVERVRHVPAAHPAHELRPASASGLGRTARAGTP